MSSDPGHSKRNWGPTRVVDRRWTRTAWALFAIGVVMIVLAPGLSYFSVFAADVAASGHAGVTIWSLLAMGETVIVTFSGAAILVFLSTRMLTRQMTAAVIAERTIGVAIFGGGIMTLVSIGLTFTLAAAGIYYPFLVAAVVLIVGVLPSILSTALPWLALRCLKRVQRQWREWEESRPAGS